MDGNQSLMAEHKKWVTCSSEFPDEFLRAAKWLELGLWTGRAWGIRSLLEVRVS